MASKTSSQKRLFRFLSEHLQSQKPFSLEELRSSSGFSTSSFKTYKTKQLNQILVPCGPELYRVHLGFRRFDRWEKFQLEVVSQNRTLVTKYEERKSAKVLVYEFFMPLRNEDLLRSGLDSLFYRDSILTRLKHISPDSLGKRFKNCGDIKNEAEFYRRVLDWVSKTFVGYSISHVNGRFKVGNLRTREEVAEAESKAHCRYLVDETTAIVRFIFPVEEMADATKTDSCVEQIEWCFETLFVKSLLEVINGEDEIWLLESGIRSRLRRFESVR